MLLAEWITWRELCVLVLCAFAVFSCANNGGPAVAPSGAPKATQFTSSSSAIGTTGSSGSSGSSGSTGTSGLTIQTFSPAAGTVASFPTTVYAQFNESNLTSTVSSPSSWTASCTCGWFASAQTVAFAGTTATIKFPSMVCPYTVASNTCSVNGSLTISDTLGNHLGGSNSVGYTVTATTSHQTLTVSNFSPVSGSSMPTTATVTFSSTSLQASTVQNVANWTLYCTSGGSIPIPTVAYNNGVATVTMPSNVLGLPAGTTCTLTPLAAITDLSGDPLQQSSATYTVATSTANLTQVGTAGGNGGSAIPDIYGPSGTSGATGQTRLLGMNVTIGSDFITEIAPSWSDRYGNYMFHGQLGPGTDTTYGTSNITCSAQWGYRAIGVYGSLTNGGCGTGGQSCIRSIGLICGMEPESAYYNPSYNSPQTTYAEGNWTVDTGASYSLQCPAGEFVTMIYGRAGSGVDQIGIACQ